MSDEKKEKSSVSLYMYTALIFIVAIFMIVLAFFGQSNLDKEKQVHSEGKSIAEKSANLSEENLVLHDKISDLNETLEAKDAQIAASSVQKTETDKVFSAQVLVNIENYAEAKNVLNTINKDALTGDALEVYNSLVKDTSKNK